MDADSPFGWFIDTHRVVSRRPARSSSHIPQLSCPPTPRSYSLSPPLPLSKPWFTRPLLHGLSTHLFCALIYHMPSSCRNISLTVAIYHEHKSVVLLSQTYTTYEFDKSRTEKRLILEPPLFVYYIGKCDFLRTSIGSVYRSNRFKETETFSQQQKGKYCRVTRPSCLRVRRVSQCHRKG